MSNTLFSLKNDTEKLPFPVPGQVSYQDFTERRFQTCDSRIFIRPVLLIQASMPAQPESISFSGIKGSCFLLYIQEGNVKLENDGNHLALTAGSVLFASAEQPAVITNREGTLSFQLLYLTGDLLWELYKLQEEPIICFSGYQFPDFEKRFTSLMNEYLKAESPLLFDFSRHMDHLISRLVHQTVKGEFDKEKYRKQALMHTVTYMKEHCCEQIQIGDIAAEFGYSSSHFSRVFQAEFHQSPKRYLLELRISHSEKRLADSTLSIEAIGLECGFNTTTHFIKTFRDLRGMTPLQYRKQSAEAAKSQAGQTA